MLALTGDRSTCAVGRPRRHPRELPVDSVFIRERRRRRERCGAGRTRPTVSPSRSSGGRCCGTCYSPRLFSCDRWRLEAGAVYRCELLGQDPPHLAALIGSHPAQRGDLGLQVRLRARQLRLHLSHLLATGLRNPVGDGSCRAHQRRGLTPGVGEKLLSREGSQFQCARGRGGPRDLRGARRHQSGVEDLGHGVRVLARRPGNRI